jgi:hypothetical protein
MTDHLTPVDMHESLDHAGLLNTVHGPGCYALELKVPDDADDVHRDWSAVHDVVPGDEVLGRLAKASRVAYVGASKDMYARLCDHCEADVRQSAYCEVFPPVDVVTLWPDQSPFDAEYSRATDLAQEGWTVTCNGEVIQG